MAAPTAAALVRTLRPRQWTKNGGVYAPLLFARAVFEDGAALRATLAAAAFCLVSGGVYVVNDWVDRERDRLHPEKRHRPIASGQISAPWAAALVAACWGAGGVLAVLARPAFAELAAGYVGLQLLYSFALKRLVIVDVVTIAFGFVLRVVAGAVAISVPVSNWLFLCTLLLAVFLGFAKRRHELTSLQAEAASHRANLSEYSLPMLDQMIAAVAAACLVAYGIYSVSPETIQHVGSDRMKFTVPFVMYGIFRYLFLIHHRGAGGSPERVLLSDPPLLVNMGLFTAVAAWALYGGA
ncbi:MAG TPA: decaprenyl-phosphate phosphoribosyltransferase [Myxococcales bacterium]|nr:decaprenyl-phosphate phosphoribosyltransferase [Myxococcales bacterium]